MFFRDIIGKNAIKKDLARTVDKGKVPHAQIFLSKEGNGSLPLALAYASYILCENKRDGDSCGECNNCIKSSKFIHPDVHFSFPVVKIGDRKRETITSDDFLPKWRKILADQPYMGSSEWFDTIEAGSSIPNINVKEINDIMHKLNMMSFESDKKVLIMWLPEYLGNEGNRLLKLIEEPTDNTYIILVSENQDMILKTILSRCQLIKIPAFSNVEIADLLVGKYNIIRVKAEQIANLADGNINLAINISNNENRDFSDLLITWLRVAYKLDSVDINAWLGKFLELNKDEQKNFFEYGLHFFRQYIFSLYTKAKEVNLTQAEVEIAAKMANIIDVPKAEQIVILLNEAIEYVGRSINMRIALFSDTITVGNILRKK
jgi:DNA polymerase-3 subunit delta'